MPQRHCQFGPQGVGQDNRAIWLQTLYLSRKGKNGPDCNSEIVRDTTPATGPEGWVCSQIGFKGGIRTWAEWAGPTPNPVCLEGRVSIQGDYSQALRSQAIGLMRVWTCLGPVTFFSFLFLCIRTGMSILCLSHHYILKAQNLSGSTGSYLERNFASGWLIPWVSPKSD